MKNLLQSYRSDLRTNWALALPIMLGQFGQVTVRLADNIMVGSLGAEELAAVSLSVAIFIILLVVGLGLSYALPPLVAQAQGEGAHQRISQYFKHSLILNLIYAIIGVLIIELIIGHLDRFGQDPTVVQLATDYLRISGWTLIPIMIFLTLRSYADGMGETKHAMWATLIGNVFNVIFNVMFIFGKFGAPRLGVAGAALGTLLSRVIMVVIIFVLIYKWKNIWTPIVKARYNKYQKAFFNKLLSLGVPTSMQMFFEVSSFAAASLIIGTIGAKEQAAHQIAINMASTTFIISMGIGMAATIRVGNHLGKKDRIGVFRAGMSSILMVVMFMGMSAILFVLFRDLIPYIYIRDPYVIGVASTLLLVAAVFQVSDGVQMVALGSLRGLQDVKVPTLITFIAYWLFGIPISYMAANYWGWGSVGVWLGLFVGLTISAILLSYRFYRSTQPAGFSKLSSI